MLFEKLLAILLQLKGGAVTLVFVTGTAVTITGTIGGEVIDLTVAPLASPTASASASPTASPAASPSPTAAASPSPSPTAAPTTQVALGSCSGDAAQRDAALQVLADVGEEAADLLRVAGGVALANGQERSKMREMLKEAGHDIRDALKDGMHDVRDLAKRILGDCDESSVEGLLSRLEHELDEVAEVHEEFERAGGRTGATFVVSFSSDASGLASPYRERVESAVEDVEDVLDELDLD
ncbi:MAG TPA: hypothetical protein VJP45_00845 [Candidatus Limnocylindria bacterium]|nr:hypothetical protein [Candidatus Limnocylindria bacterium]